MAMRSMRNGPDHGNHLIHHVVRQMTVQHPVAYVFRIKLNVASLSDTHEHGVLVDPALDGPRPPSVPVTTF
jgi:hypothetical protein